MEKGSKDSIFFVYKNTGKEPLKIESISSSCRCTIPFWSREKLMPNKKDSLLIKFDSKFNNKEGYFYNEIYMISNSKNSPDVLRIQGFINKEQKDI